MSEKKKFKLKKKEKPRWAIGGFVRLTKSGDALKFSPTEDLLRERAENQYAYAVIKISDIEKLVAGEAPKNFILATIPPRPKGKAEYEIEPEIFEGFED